ncbi:MAG: hypothetical protein M3347_15320 [Armatimonadota bacterium]|nr:hypothetical protein [Armatimonadota bacterium]
MAPVIENLGANTRAALSAADPDFPTDDDCILTYLLERYEASFLRLKTTVPMVCDRYGARYWRRAAEIRRCMLQSHIYADLAQVIQKSLPDTPEATAFEGKLVAWRGLDGASAASADKAQRLAPAGVVATPFELVEQGDDFFDHKRHFESELAAGRVVPLTRVVFSHGNRFQWSPFWTPGGIDFDPFADTTELQKYLFDKGIPAHNNAGRAFVVMARLVPGATFVVRAAPGVGANIGGGEEIVTTFDGVEIEASAATSRFVKYIVRTGSAS